MSQLAAKKAAPTSTEKLPDERGIPHSINIVPFSSSAAITDGTHTHINSALEDKLFTANRSLIDTLEKIKDQSQARLDGSDEDRPVAYYHDVISQYTTPATAKPKDDALTNRLTRRDLFQHGGVTDVFHKPEYRQVMVTSRDIDKYTVPRYNPPVLPPQASKRGTPSYKKGMKDGYYIYKSSSGNEYAGHWKNGRRHGYGIANYRDGEVFNGEWRRGRRHGHGILHLANSEVFDGDWVDNKKSGLGVYYWKDGEVDVSWYHDDVRLESLRWTNDRRRAYLLDLSSSRKEQISLVRAATTVKVWERKRVLSIEQLV